MGRLDGRVGFITGGARGQGRAIAAKLAAEGADIVLCDICSQIESVAYPLATQDDLRATADLIESAGRECMAEAVDVRDLPALTDFAQRAVERFDRIDVVCANAGIVSYGAFWELSQQAWDDMIAVNLTGVFNTVKAVAPGMMQRRRGSIILTSSVNGVEAAGAITHYTAAKAGVIGLAKSFALELGPFGVRVNCILPGPVLTPMTDNPPTRDYILQKEGATTADFIEATRGWHLLRGRPCLPASAIADTIIWLASDESLNITGAEIPVDAGHLVLPGINLAPVHDDDQIAFDFEANALTP
jgi:SDR family mycofactocin-dependent oxidoreductase